MTNTIFLLFISVFIFAVGDILGVATKARLSSVFVALMLFLVGFLTGILPPDIIKQAMLQDIARALNGKNLPDNKTDWIGNFFANATVGSIKQWASSGMKRAHPESYADSFGIAHECLEWIVLRHAGTK